MKKDPWYVLYWIINILGPYDGDCLLLLSWRRDLQWGHVLVMEPSKTIIPHAQGLNFVLLNVKHHSHELSISSKLTKRMMILLDISHWEILVDWFVIYIYVQILALVTIKFPVYCFNQNRCARFTIWHIVNSVSKPTLYISLWHALKLIVM